MMFSRQSFSFCKAAGFVAPVIMLVILLTGFYSCKNPALPIQPPPASQPIFPADTSPTVNNSANVTTPANNATIPTSLSANRNYLSARFSGLVTFNVSGATVINATEFTMPRVPLVWAGHSFSGEIKQIGHLEYILYQTAGNVSPDGSKLESVVYSRKIIRASNDGNFYRISISNLPISSAANASQQGWETFKGTGADLQNYITMIEYAAGPTAGEEINPQTTYLSTDWANMNPGKKPVFSLSFQGEVNASASAPDFNAADVAPSAAKSWNLGEKADYILVTARNWNSYYDTAPQGADFNNYVYLVASLGPKPNPGYGVEIIYIQQTGDELTVKLRLNMPQPDMIYAQVIVYPVAAVSINKSDLGAYSTLTAVFIDDNGKQIATARASP